VSEHSGAAPAAVCDYPLRFLYGDELVGANVTILLFKTARPQHCEAGGACDAEPEVKTKVIAGVIARLAENLLGLRASGVVSEHTSANGTDSILYRQDEL